METAAGCSHLQILLAARQKACPAGSSRQSDANGHGTLTAPHWCHVLIGVEDAASILEEAPLHPRRSISTPFMSEDGVFTLHCPENILLVRPIRLMS